MKKQYFIIPAIACMTAIFSVHAQNTPFDDILKRFSSREGITIVSMGEQQLKSMFTPPQIITMKEENLFLRKIGDKTPTYYSSVTISRKDIPKYMLENTISSLMKSGYEKSMEINKEDADVLVYLSNFDNRYQQNFGEVMVLRQQNGFFSAIYLAGHIDLSQVDMYLQVIKQSLDSRYKTTSSITTIDDDNRFPSLGVEEIKALLKRNEEKYKMGQIGQEEMLKLKWQYTPLSDEEINSLLKINEERFKMGRISETEMLAQKRKIEEMKKR